MARRKKKHKKRIFTGERIKKKRPVFHNEAKAHKMSLAYKKKSAPFVVTKGFAFTELWGIAFCMDEKEFLLLTPFKYDAVNAMRAVNYTGQIEMKKAQLLAVLPSDNLRQRLEDIL